MSMKTEVQRALQCVMIERTWEGRRTYCTSAQHVPTVPRTVFQQVPHTEVHIHCKYVVTAGMRKLKVSDSLNVVPCHIILSV